MNVPKAKVADAGCSVTVLRRKGVGGEEGFQEDSVPSRIIRTEVGLRKGPGTELVFHIDELPSLAPLSAFSRSWEDLPWFIYKYICFKSAEDSWAYSLLEFVTTWSIYRGRKSEMRAMQ